MLNDEYYVVESTDESCLFSWDQDSTPFDTGQPVKYNGPVKVHLGEPVPDRPVFVDYHEMFEPVISQKIYDVLKPLDLYGIQLVPVEMRAIKAPFTDIPNYWFIHVWNRIRCIDTEKSEIDIDEEDGEIWGIDQLVLDEQALSRIALPKRLLFEPFEDKSMLIVHQSIKDIIESVKPVGIRFFAVPAWNSDLVFD